MIRTLIITASCSAVIVCAFVVTNRQQTPTPVDKSGDLTEVPGSEIQSPPRIVSSLKPFAWDFEVINPLPEAIQFVGVRPSCQCTEAKLDNQSIAAGGRTTLRTLIRTSEVDIDPKSITVTLDDVKGRMWRYRLVTKTYPVLRIPGSSTNCFVGEVDAGEPLERRVTMYVYQSDRAVSHALTFTQADNVKISPEWVGVEEVAAGIYQHAYETTIRIPDTGTGGVAQQIFSINVTGEDSTTRQWVVSWRVRPLFEISPSELRFGYVPRDLEEPIERTCTLKRLDGKPLEVLDIALDTEGVEIELAKANSASVAVLSARLDPRKSTSAFRRMLQLRTNHERQPLLNIWVSAVH